MSWITSSVGETDIAPIGGLVGVLFQQQHGGTRAEARDYILGTTLRLGSVVAGFSPRSTTSEERFQLPVFGSQIIARIRQIETLVTEREVGNDVLQDGVVQSRPVGK